MNLKFWEKPLPKRYKAYDPCPIIHMRNNHGGNWRLLPIEDCPECNAIKAKYPDADFTSDFPFRER